MQPNVIRTAGPIQTLVMMIIFGLVFLGAAVAFYFGDQIPSSWIKENGTISSYTTSYGGQHGPSYCAIVTYKVNGISYQVNGTTCGGGLPSVGAPAQIAYNPSNPASAKVVSGIGDIFFIGLSGIIGLALLIFAPIAYRKAKNGPAGPASVFTTQWPHVPNQVVTTTMPPNPAQPTAPANPVQPVMPPPTAPQTPATDQPVPPTTPPPAPAPVNPSADPSQPPDLDNPPS